MREALRERPSRSSGPDPHGDSAGLAEPRPTVARYLIHGARPPHLRATLPFAEAVRAALLKASDGAPVFLGKRADGSPLTGHQHAFILPEANGPQLCLTHVTVHAPMGLDRVARRALEQLRRIWAGRTLDTEVVLLGIGQPEDFAGFQQRAGQCPLLERSRVWISATPFINTRHEKRRTARTDGQGRALGSAAHEVTRLLRELGYPAPQALEPLSGARTTAGELPWPAFHTKRSTGHGRRGSGQVTGFRLTFPTPVQGPLALGYGAHFGMGRFTPGR